LRRTPLPLAEVEAKTAVVVGGVLETAEAPDDLEIVLRETWAEDNVGVASGVVGIGDTFGSAPLVAESEGEGV